MLHAELRAPARGIQYLNNLKGHRQADCLVEVEVHIVCKQFAKTPEITPWNWLPGASRSLLGLFWGPLENSLGASWGPLGGGIVENASPT